MATLSIGELAGRSGLSASTLRYYEDVGVLAPPDRSASGYRRYDEGVVGHLAFIRRAKELGCTLEEIADLVGPGTAPTAPTAPTSRSGCGSWWRRRSRPPTSTLTADQRLLRYRARHAPPGRFDPG